MSVAWLETGEEDAAEALAELVLEHEGRPLPPLAGVLAIRVLGQRRPGQQAGPSL